ncbi:MAG: hypothetical protein LBR53_00770 [Deltaproteobacteria bacterium]|jgi:hypothetical protein|nr:hypothetical protein [Deltaproteobacteria bacterium]
MKKFLFSVFIIMSIIHFFSVSLTAQNSDNKNTIEFSEISRFIHDAPIFLHPDLIELPVITISGLIGATINIFKDAGVNIFIYNNNTTFYNPEADVYIALVSEGKKIGFSIIQTNHEELKEDSLVLFSFTCIAEGNFTSGVICSEPEVFI